MTPICAIVKVCDACCAKTDKKRRLARSSSFARSRRKGRERTRSAPSRGGSKRLTNRTRSSRAETSTRNFASSLAKLSLKQERLTLRPLGLRGEPPPQPLSRGSLLDFAGEGEREAEPLRTRVRSKCRPKRWRHAIGSLSSATCPGQSSRRRWTGSGSTAAGRACQKPNSCQTWCHTGVRPDAPAPAHEASTVRTGRRHSAGSFSWAYAPQALFDGQASGRLRAGRRARSKYGSIPRSPS